MEIFLKMAALSGVPYPEAVRKNPVLDKKLQDRLGQNRDGAAVWLTDDAGVAERLLKAGECVVYLLTEENREDFCSGVSWCVLVPEAESADGGNPDASGWRQVLCAAEQGSFPDWLSEEFLWRVWLRKNDLPWLICETDKLVLREMMEEDLDFVLEMQKEETGRDGAESRAAEYEKLAAYREQMYGFYGFGIWLILEKESGLPVGRAGLQMRDGYTDPELGFSIAPAWREKGYAEEACRAVLDMAWKELEIDRVYAAVDRENIKSRRLCKKLGFTEDHVEKKDGRTYIFWVKERGGERDANQGESKEHFREEKPNPAGDL